MQVQVAFGTATAEFRVEQERLVSGPEQPPPQAIQDVAAATVAALEQPLGFPPLRQALIPGDRVTIVVDKAMAQPELLLHPVLDYLRDAGVRAEQICVVEAAPLSEPSSAPLSGTPAPVSPHNPNDRACLRYLASTRSGCRIYLNRDLVDADVLILIGQVRYDPVMGYSGTASSIFPALADEAARRAFQAWSRPYYSAQMRAERRRQIDEVGWLLGAPFAVQIVPGRGDQVLDLLAGDCLSVQRAAQERLDRAWRRRWPRRAELVVAGISDPPARQGFTQLGAALEAATRLTAPGGRVAVLSAINASPGPALKLAQSHHATDRLLKLLLAQPLPDAVCTHQIVQAAQSVKVFLLSRLQSQLVTDLFMTPLDDLSQVQRLIDQAASCLIINDAQMVSTADCEEGREGAIIATEL